MNKHNIDQLFQSKISDMEIAPSAAAKAKFEQALAQKHATPFVWWRIAAVFLVLAVSTVLIITLEKNDKLDYNGLADANTPLPQTTPELIFSENEILQIQMEQELQQHKAEESQYAQTERGPASSSGKTTKPKSVLQNTTTLIAETTPPQPIEMETTATAIEEKISLPTEETLVAEQVEKKRLPVTIIYKPGARQDAMIAAATKEPVSEEEDKLSFLELLQSAANRPLMAELRGAKDEFISGSISFRPKKSKN